VLAMRYKGRENWGLVGDRRYHNSMRRNAASTLTLILE
jgi:hypothetical protein